MELGLAGKTVIVTGSGSNIGRAIALGFAREKANVVIAELDQEQGEKVAREARESGAQAMAVKVDVTDLGQVEAMMKKTLEAYKTIDVLVNNVGWDQLQPFTDTNVDFWNRVIDLNYKSVLNTVKSVLPHMKEQGGGSIVNIGSDAGRLGERFEAVYSGTKGAVILFSKSVAREMGRFNVRVNVVCPGMTVPSSEEEIGEKSMWKAGVLSEEQKAKAVKAYPLGRVGKPEDLGAAVVFLASGAATFITGQTISVSGGYSMV